MNLFDKSGAEFSVCRKYRYALWRIWDESKPLVMFIGLNPSTADEFKPDPTIKSVERIAHHNDFGGFYMMNCFAFVTANPEELEFETNNDTNDFWLKKIAYECKSIVFAWGAFPVVSSTGRLWEMKEMFGDEALTIGLNKNGSPKHPLFCKGATKLIPFQA